MDRLGRRPSYAYPWQRTGTMALNTLWNTRHSQHITFVQRATLRLVSAEHEALRTDDSTSEQDQGTFLGILSS